MEKLAKPSWFFPLRLLIAIALIAGPLALYFQGDTGPKYLLLPTYFLAVLISAVVGMDSWPDAGSYLVALIVCGVAVWLIVKPRLIPGILLVLYLGFGTFIALWG